MPVWLWCFASTADCLTSPIDDTGALWVCAAAVPFPWAGVTADLWNVDVSHLCMNLPRPCSASEPTGRPWGVWSMGVTPMTDLFARYIYNSRHGRGISWRSLRSADRLLRMCGNVRLRPQHDGRAHSAVWYCIPIYIYNIDLKHPHSLYTHTPIHAYPPSQPSTGALSHRSLTHHTHASSRAALRTITDTISGHYSRRRRGYGRADSADGPGTHGGGPVLPSGSARGPESGDRGVVHWCCVPPGGRGGGVSAT